MKKGCGLKQKRMKEGTINCLFYLFLPRVSKKGLRTFVPKFSRGVLPIYQSYPYPFSTLQKLFSSNLPLGSDFSALSLKETILPFAVGSAMPSNLF